MAPLRWSFDRQLIRDGDEVELREIRKSMAYDHPSVNPFRDLVKVYNFGVEHGSMEEKFVVYLSNMLPPGSTKSSAPPPGDGGAPTRSGLPSARRSHLIFPGDVAPAAQLSSRATALVGDAAPASLLSSRPTTAATTIAVPRNPNEKGKRVLTASEVLTQEKAEVETTKAVWREKEAARQKESSKEVRRKERESRRRDKEIKKRAKEAKRKGEQEKKTKKRKAVTSSSSDSEDEDDDEEGDSDEKPKHKKARKEKELEKKGQKEKREKKAKVKQEKQRSSTVEGAPVLPILGLDVSQKPLTGFKTLVQQRIQQSCKHFFPHLPVWAEVKSDETLNDKFLVDVRSAWTNGATLCTRYIEDKAMHWLKDQRHRAKEKVLKFYDPVKQEYNQPSGMPYVTFKATVKRIVGKGKKSRIQVEKAKAAAAQRRTAITNLYGRGGYKGFKANFVSF